MNEENVQADNPEHQPEALSEVGPGVPSAAVANKPKKKKKNKKEAGGSLGTSRGIETMFRTAYRVNLDLTALADAKANIMVTINGLILSILLASISPKIDANQWLLFPTVIMLLTCMLSMVYAILAARPRLSSTVISLDDVKQDRANILFFGNFVHLNKDEFEEGMTELMVNSDRLYHNMIRDIYGIGSVLQKKYQYVRVAYTIFMIGLVLSVIMFILVYFLVATPSAILGP